MNKAQPAKMYNPLFEYLSMLAVDNYGHHVIDPAGFSQPAKQIITFLRETPTQHTAKPSGRHAVYRRDPYYAGVFKH